MSSESQQGCPAGTEANKDLDLYGRSVSAVGILHGVKPYACTVLAGASVSTGADVKAACGITVYQLHRSRRVAATIRRP